MVLDITHAELKRHFSLSSLVVQHYLGCFCIIRDDMKVKKIIQYVTNGPGGNYLVAVTRNSSVMAEFELLFFKI